MRDYTKPPVDRRTRTPLCLSRRPAGRAAAMRDREHLEVRAPQCPSCLRVGDRWSDSNDRLCAAAAEVVIEYGGCVVHRGENGADSLGLKLSLDHEGEHPGDQR